MKKSTRALWLAGGGIAFVALVVALILLVNLALAPSKQPTVEAFHTLEHTAHQLQLTSLSPATAEVDRYGQIPPRLTGPTLVYSVPRPDASWARHLSERGERLGLKGNDQDIWQGDVQGWYVTVTADLQARRGLRVTLTAVPD